MRWKGKISDVGDSGVKEAARNRFTDEAGLEKALKDFRKDSEKVNVPHERAPITSYDMKNAVVSLTETYRVLRRISYETTSSWTSRREPYEPCEQLGSS